MLLCAVTGLEKVQVNEGSALCIMSLVRYDRRAG